MSIEVTELTKIYGEQKAVNNISFRVSPGEIVGFLGPNGAGKSTTMKIITGYLQADEGHTLVCGIDVLKNPMESKKKVGYLPEANPLYTDMYVREYLRFVAGVHGIGHKKEQTEEAIRITGLTPESKKKIGQLSKGYRQRVGLAAALIHDPEVLVLDEPTSGLDPNQIVGIRDVIKELGKRKTVLFSSHILQEVEAVCDRVIIIHKGRLVADDALRNLQQNTNQAVLVAFKEPVGKALLESLPEVEKAEQVEDGGFRLRSANPEKVRRQLLELAVQHNLNILSLRNESHSLEEVFRELTR